MTVQHAMIQKFGSDVLKSDRQTGANLVFRAYLDPDDYIYVEIN